MTLKTSNFRAAYANSRPPQTREMLWDGVAQLLQAYCARTGIPWDYEGAQFLCLLQVCAAISCALTTTFPSNKLRRLPHLTASSVCALQEEADKNKHDTIPQAVQRMWTSPQRLRRKELCSILNFAVRCDGKEIVQPLAVLVSPSFLVECNAQT